MDWVKMAFAMRRAVRRRVRAGMRPLALWFARFFDIITAGVKFAPVSVFEVRGHGRIPRGGIVSFQKR